MIHRATSRHPLSEGRLRDRFRPEFLNHRVDEVVTFEPLPALSSSPRSSTSSSSGCAAGSGRATDLTRSHRCGGRSSSPRRAGIPPARRASAEARDPAPPRGEPAQALELLEIVAGSPRATPCRPSMFSPVIDSELRLRARLDRTFRRRLQPTWSRPADLLFSPSGAYDRRSQWSRSSQDGTPSWRPCGRLSREVSDEAATAVVLEGQAGMGKTTLWRAAVERADEPVLLVAPGPARQSENDVVVRRCGRSPRPPVLEDALEPVRHNSPATCGSRSALAAATTRGPARASPHAACGAP